MARASKATVILSGYGRTGRRVIHRLLARRVPVRLASRTSPVAFDWENERTWERAVVGARALYIAYHQDLSAGEAARRIEGVCALAARAGVERVVLLSERGEPRVQPAERAVRRSGLDFTILRCALFSQNFSEGMLAPVDGIVFTPVGEVREPFVDCDDLAAVAVAALTVQGHSGQTYELTGPQTLSFVEAVDAIRRAAGGSVECVQLPFERYREWLQASASSPGAVLCAERFAQRLGSRFNGHAARPTADVERVLGRPAKGFEAFVHDPARVWKARL